MNIITAMFHRQAKESDKEEPEKVYCRECKYLYSNDIYITESHGCTHEENRGYKDTSLERREWYGFIDLANKDNGCKLFEQRIDLEYFI